MEGGDVFFLPKSRAGKASSDAGTHHRGDAPNRGTLKLIAALQRPGSNLEVIIPAFNEELRLAATLGATIEFLSDRPWSSSVVVVDNGSVDNTSEVAELFSASPVPVRLIGCSRQGKGAAVRRGFMTSGADVVGFMDADLATHLGAIDTVMELMKDGHAAVIGSRYSEHSRIGRQETILRRVGGAAFRSVVSHIVESVDDTQCGFKFFQGDLIRRVSPRCRIDGFAFDVELLRLIQRSGHDVIEIPVEWDWDGGSTFNMVRDGVPAFRDVLRLRMRISDVETAEPILANGELWHGVDSEAWPPSRSRDRS